MLGICGHFQASETCGLRNVEHLVILLRREMYTIYNPSQRSGQRPKTNWTSLGIAFSVVTGTFFLVPSTGRGIQRKIVPGTVKRYFLKTVVTCTEKMYRVFHGYTFRVHPTFINFLLVQFGKPLWLIFYRGKYKITILLFSKILTLSLNFGKNYQFWTSF